MKVVITARELMDRYLWDRACDRLGWSPWVVNEGQIDMDDEVTLPGEMASELGLLAPGVVAPTGAQPRKRDGQLTAMKATRIFCVLGILYNLGACLWNLLSGDWIFLALAIAAAVLAACVAWQTQMIGKRAAQLRPRPDYSRIAGMEREIWDEAFEHAGAPHIPRVVATRTTYACTGCGRDAHTTRRMCARCYKQMNWG